MVQLLRQADVYCLPTRYAEGFPTTLLEAATCRCPIVCTRTAGTEELLPDDTHGIVLPGQPQDATVETIRAGLQTLLDDPARAPRLCRGGVPQCVRALYMGCRI